ncbi:MAG: hypothetical protein HY329_14185 [Chloroflexi bacterium]|nr:hypothetical protein [Chloroflexota bacterium]
MARRPPVEYVPWTLRRYPDAPPYRWTVNETAPLTPLTKPLSECRVALITSGGVHLKDQVPFDPEKNDLTYREIPKDVKVSELLISHHSQYAERTVDGQYDLNSVAPIERFVELERSGYIGELFSPVISFMGRCFKRTELQTELAPQILQLLQAGKVDAVFMVPV